MTLLRCLLLASITCWGMGVRAQPKLELDLKKPKEFEDRKLGSEKMAEKKFTVVRRLFQNTYTHYNYYFNANNLLNEIVERASLGHQDDYTELLPYYKWSLENTSTATDLDSVLQKCTAGILLHDLRNDWIDNMYLLMGRAYYLRKDFDSAAMTFQYINYAYAPSDKSGNKKTIGSNENDGTNAFSISTREKKTHILKRPPSRNEAFVWQIRNLTDKGDFIEASSMITLLNNDPQFPERLHTALSESIAYLYYKQESWDSAAAYLVKAMPVATNQEDKARRWYLAGQLFQLAGQYQEASNAYAQCTRGAMDPVMEVYARLNTIRLNKGDDPAIIDNNIASLLAMAKRDKYYNYRDIIYYAAALFELERDGYDAAAGYLTKSIAANENNPEQRSRSFMLLGDVRYEQKAYGPAGPPYDSVLVSLLKPLESEKVEARKPGTLLVFEAEKAISLQDSLLRLADMPEDERTQFVRRLSRQLQKQLGIKEEDPSMGTTATIGGNPAATSNLFASAGTWYFYEPNIRANGFNNFKQRWGARPNVDNWRRSSAIGLNVSGTSAPGTMADSSLVAGSGSGSNLGDNFDTTDVSFDNLYSRIPISEERRFAANDRVINALLVKGQAIHEKIEDYPEAIKVFEEILRRRDSGLVVQKTLFALIHCYTKVGNIAAADEARRRLLKEFGESAEALALGNKSQADPSKPSEALINKTYGNIYDLFISGNFTEALAARKRADSLLGNSYWTPQLLYIQSIHHIVERDDSLAIKQLTDITTLFGSHPLSDKATRMIDVLRRRTEIEDYLGKLNIKRATDDPFEPVNIYTPLPEQPVDTLAVVAVDTELDKELAAKAEKEAAEKLRMEKEAAEKLLAEKQAAEKEAAEKALAEKLAAEQSAAERLRLEKEAAEKAEAERLLLEKEAAEKSEADRLRAEKDAAEKSEAERLRAEKEAAEKAEAERLRVEKEAAEKAAAEKALAEKQAAEKLAAEKQLAEKMAAEREAAEKARAEKEAAEREAAAKALAEKLAAEKEAAEREMAQKNEAEKAAAAKALAEKQAAERLAAEKALAEKIASEKAAAEKERLEQEAADRAAAEKALADRQAAEKAAAEKALAEKQAAEKAAAEKAAADKSATDRAAAEKALAEKQAEEKAAAEKAASEKAAADRAAAEKALAEKQAADKLAADKSLAEKQAAEKQAAEKERLQREASEKLRLQQAEADRIAAAKAQAEKLAAEKAAREKEERERGKKIDGVVVGTPVTASPYQLKPDAQQVVAIVLERIDPAYVNEVSYTLGNNAISKYGENEVEVTKKKIKDNLWFVEIRSKAFTNIQEAYNYIQYIKPLAQNELFTWLDPSKYFILPITELDLRTMEKEGDIQLYRKILGEAIPGKF